MTAVHVTIVKASSKGQIVLPKRIRQNLDIRPGQKVALRLVGDHAEIKPLPRDPIESLHSIFKDYPGSLADELLTERRKDREREEAEITRFARRPGLPQRRKRARKG
ncbi:MAG: AbrB/MazE/SpoVT family DNA-binding domain-containing protein [candidate division NC10 bacterium]|nr:AbrB/MazE/SpoVT family DNA-binding domain-containing protein [candidate division NC10 bacterium]